MKKIYSGNFTIHDLGKTIFLAGCSPRGEQVLNWRKEAVEILEKLGFDGTVVIPEPEHGKWANYDDVIEWEDFYMSNSDVILFWIPRDISNGILGLTSNVEFGKYLDSGKIFYGRPNNADNVRYLDYWYTKRYETNPHNNLQDLIEECLEFLSVRR
jgi:hypothetical protein